MNLKTLIKRNQGLYCWLLQINNFLYAFREYIAADDIVNSTGGGYLLLSYVNQGSGIMTEMLTVLGWLRFAKEKKKTLIVDIKNDFVCYRGEQGTRWDDFFQQPMLDKNISVSEMLQLAESVSPEKCPQNTRFNLTYYGKLFRLLSCVFPPRIVFPLPRDYKTNPTIHQEYIKLYKEYIRFNPLVLDYIEKECEELLSGKGIVLGVIARGTDYSQKKPSKHPVQPEVKDIISKIKSLPSEKRWDFIYLATEEQATQNQFEEAFPGKILVNKRCYYDGDYSEKLLCEVKNERENDEYLRSLEYLSSMYILSKCNMLIGGLCGGSQAALIMRGEKEYEYLYLFDLGNYQ